MTHNHALENEEMLVVAAMVSEETTSDPIVVSSEEKPLAVKIRNALLAEPRLGGADLFVSVEGEHATLSGTVRTEEQRDIALRVAGRYVGRDRVKDQIQTGDQLSYDVCES